MVFVLIIEIVSLHIFNFMAYVRRYSFNKVKKYEIKYNITLKIDKIYKKWQRLPSIR
jgi:hypothetical protein